MFHGFYNLDHVGDIMLARIEDGKTFSYDKYDDLVVLKDKKENVLNKSLVYILNEMLNISVVYESPTKGSLAKSQSGEDMKDTLLFFLSYKFLLFLISSIEFI